MTPERWKRIEELYHEARARAPADRSAFLAVACVDDEALRRNVESLLDESESDDGFLADPPLDMSPQTITTLLATRVGATIGGYELRELLGAGGMGEVYRAHDAKLGRDVAIKILPSAFTNNPDRLARLEREARMLASLNHPTICAIYGFEEASGIRFLILELVEGETLADTLAHASSLHKKDSGLPLGRVLDIARQIAEALEVAHDKGIVHRDLKPGNIKITPEGAVKVLDFGLAKAVHGDGSSPDLSNAPTEDSGRRQGAVVGTAAYMSPEQARGLPVDKRTDIWAFGCVLYEMLTGYVAFPGDTTSDSIAKILEREPVWSALPSATPESIRRLLLRCLVKDPKQRLRDIGDVRIEIDTIDEVLPGATATPVPLARTRSRRTWLPWAALVLLAVAVVTWEASKWEATRLVSGERTVERTLRIPLAFMNIPAQLELVGEPPTVVDVRVRGASVTVSRLSAGDMAAILDVHTPRPGQRLYHLTGSEVRAPLGVDVVQVTPSTIALFFERSSVKTVAVMPVLEGRPADGYMVDRVTVDPAKVEVVGPASALNRLTSAATQAVSVEGAKTTVTESVPVGPTDPTARLRAPLTARVTVTIIPVR